MAPTQCMATRRAVYAACAWAIRASASVPLGGTAAAAGCGGRPAAGDVGRWEHVECFLNSSFLDLADMPQFLQCTCHPFCEQQDVSPLREGTATQPAQAFVPADTADVGAWAFGLATICTRCSSATLFARNPHVRQCACLLRQSQQLSSCVLGTG